MSMICKIITLSAVVLSLSGCILAAAGAGAAGAVYVKDHYNISIHKKAQSKTKK